ncbi:MAG: hypothetical protein AB7G06_03680 [Bdellovibrionales bacterium]
MSRSVVAAAASFILACGPAFAQTAPTPSGRDLSPSSVGSLPCPTTPTLHYGPTPSGEGFYAFCPSIGAFGLAENPLLIAVGPGVLDAANMNLQMIVGADGVFCRATIEIAQPANPGDELIVSPTIYDVLDPAAGNTNGPVYTSAAELPASASGCAGDVERLSQLVLENFAQQTGYRVPTARLLSLTPGDPA